jgi:hypothetical protein
LSPGGGIGELVITSFNESSLRGETFRKLAAAFFASTIDQDGGKLPKGFAIFSTGDSPNVRL